jgi:hypothetical protein
MRVFLLTAAVVPFGIFGCGPTAADVQRAEKLNRMSDERANGAVLDYLENNQPSVGNPDATARPTNQSKE